MDSGVGVISPTKNQNQVQVTQESSKQIKNQMTISESRRRLRDVSSKHPLGELELRPAFLSSNRSGQKQQPKGEAKCGS